MKIYEMAVVVQTITVRAESEEQAEEMYDRYHSSGKETTCPNHPEVEVGGNAWDCGCAYSEDDIYHITTHTELVEEMN
jgi:hypothetical protein|tara:strand:+ start:587 stop:820 length:234 start_codon:yes stop_codon:yes gene_type:complete